MYIVCSGFELTNLLAGMARWQAFKGKIKNKNQTGIRMSQSQTKLAQLSIAGLPLKFCRTIHDDK